MYYSCRSIMKVFGTFIVVISKSYPDMEVFGPYFLAFGLNKKGKKEIIKKKGHGGREPTNIFRKA